MLPSLEPQSSAPEVRLQDLESGLRFSLVLRLVPGSVALGEALNLGQSSLREQGCGSRLRVLDVVPWLLEASWHLYFPSNLPDGKKCLLLNKRLLVIF